MKHTHRGIKYSLRQRGGSLLLDYRDQGVRRRVTLRSRTGSAAVLEAERVLDGTLDGVPEGTWTLQEAVDRTYATRWQGMKSEGTALLNARVLVRFFGAECPVDTIGTSEVDDLVEYLRRQGSSDGTINRKLSTLRTVLKVAHDRGKLDRVPKIPQQRESKGRIRWLTYDEEDTVVRLLRQWDQPVLAALVVFLVDTGVRRGEALKLEWRDVDWEGLRVHLWETKADHPRTVPLTTRARDALVVARQYTAGFPSGNPRRTTPAGFPEGSSSRVWPVTIDTLRHYWDRARGTMGLHEDAQFVVHALRHTCASRLVQKGVPLKTVQEYLGHKDITTTMRYAHLAPANLKSAAEALERETAEVRRLREVL